MKPDPNLRIPPRPPRLPRDHFAMRPRASEGAKGRVFVVLVIALVFLYAYLHR